MNSSEPNSANLVDQEAKKDQLSVPESLGIKPKSKPSMSKREIMEELSRKRFPWEE